MIQRLYSDMWSVRYCAAVSIHITISLFLMCRILVYFKTDLTESDHYDTKPCMTHVYYLSSISLFTIAGTLRYNYCGNSNPCGFHC